MPDSLSRGYTKIRDIGSGSAKALFVESPGSYDKAVLVQDKEDKLYVMKIIDMSRMDTKQRKERRKSLQELLCFAAVQDAINEVRVLSSLKHPYIVQGLSCLESL